MTFIKANPNHRSLTRTQLIRSAVLRSFCEDQGAVLLDQRVSSSEWLDLERWLHTSGLALYFLDWLHAHSLAGILPAAMRDNLQQNLEDNTLRSQALFNESNELNELFQTNGIIYANLKGITLWPLAVPDLCLRSQLDLDFLIRSNHVTTARHLLERHGYRLHAISGKSWEFKKNEHKTPSLKDLYRPTPYRSLELHVEPIDSLRLRNVETRRIQGVEMPTLSPVDLYSNQALHLFRHICSEFTRLSWLIEFRRHTLARFDDSAFWVALCDSNSTNQLAATKIAITSRIVTELMDDFLPPLMKQALAPQVPVGADLWAKRYSHRALLSNFPGSKLYLLLQRELSAHHPATSSVRRSLIPLRLPPSISRATSGEPLQTRVQRYRKQLGFIAFRFRFHVVEGLKYAHESLRWRQLLSEQSR